MLAFVHIEKCAGTTLKSILRANFGFRYAEVRPLSPASERTFRPADLRYYRRLNPLLGCIVGHSVKPWANLESVVPDIRYITLLREPVQRYLSYYRYGGGRHRKPWPFSFEQYLEMEPFRNFQVRKLAGCEDLEAAIRILEERFLLAGDMAEFDEFVCLLQATYTPKRLDIRYKRLNESRRPADDPLLTAHRDSIEAANSLDLALYRHLHEVLLPRARAAYPGDLASAVDAFQRDAAPSRLKRAFGAAAWRLQQRLLLGPVTGRARRRAGLPAAGQY
ncbi:sulfotransferase family 2 domain-containing protein [Halochromatium glycolicum]|uniref:Sulfotransferase family protein n=1 Tax=Halochromatium glycolicum TaxID=85075 RepID=A0AAJ0U6S6_9GAMM|nr:sulfotransferase family 2 domain-containing protein [Halochromatium glycolicum]MBK1706365.1 hypothetical protein [Halochromatium glycolicum]